MASGGVSVGDKYGRLTAVQFDHMAPRSRAVWKWKCGCGNDYIARADSVKAGIVVSCGCHKNKMAAITHTKHGEYKSITYTTWAAIKARCTNPKASYFEYYGGRGIKVCERWMGSYENFLADMGERPSMEHSIERENVDGDYEPGNCRWATKIEQARNKSTSVMVTYQNRVMNLSDAAASIGCYAYWLKGWLDRGLTVDEVVVYKAELSKRGHILRDTVVEIIILTPDGNFEALMDGVHYVVVSETMSGVNKIIKLVRGTFSSRKYKQ